MATTRITSTRDGSSAIDYASQQSKPHDNSNPNVNKRVLRLSTYNCSVQNYKKQMQAVWTANHTKQRKRIELYRITQSFARDELDIDDTKHLKKNLDLANRAGMKLAKKLYPDRQFIVSTQADGTGHMIHNHIDIVNPDYVTGKAIRGMRTRQGYIAEVSDEVCKSLGINMSNNLSPVKHGSMMTKSSRTVNKNKQSRSKSGKSSFLQYIQDVVDKVSSDSHVYSTDQFAEKCKTLGVDVKFRKRKSGTVTGVSYKLDNSEMKRAVRGNRLGSNFQVDYLIRLFKEHEKNKAVQKPVTKPRLKPVKKQAKNESFVEINRESNKLPNATPKIAKTAQKRPNKSNDNKNPTHELFINQLNQAIDIGKFEQSKRALKNNKDKSKSK